jgi:hypothetical protein
MQSSEVKDDMEHNYGQQQRVLKITKGEYSVRCTQSKTGSVYQAMLCERKKFLIIAYISTNNTVICVIK